MNWFGPSFQMVDNAIHKINYYPMDNAMGFPNTVEPSLTATSLQRPLFFSPADKKIYSLTLLLNVSTTAIQVSLLRYTYRPSSTSCVLFFNANWLAAIANSARLFFNACPFSCKTAMCKLSPAIQRRANAEHMLEIAKTLVTLAEV